MIRSTAAQWLPRARRLLVAQRSNVAQRFSAAMTIVAALAVTALAQAPDRTHPPQPGPPPALHLPAIQKQKLANGLPVWIVELHEVPVAQVNLVVFSGTANDPPGRYGAASLTAAMLEQGAGSRSA